MGIRVISQTLSSPCLLVVTWPPADSSSLSFSFSRLKLLCAAGVGRHVRVSLQVVKGGTGGGQRGQRTRYQRTGSELKGPSPCRLLSFTLLTRRTAFWSTPIRSLFEPNSFFMYFSTTRQKHVKKSPTTGPLVPRTRPPEADLLRRPRPRPS